MGTLKRASDPASHPGCNIPLNQVSMTCSIGNAVVNFRPQDTYKGEFGFDWMRVGDWRQAGEVSKSSTVAGLVPVTDNYRDTSSDYTKLENEYAPMPFKQGISHPLQDKYYRHWLSLFPADLASRINADVAHPPHSELMSAATLDVYIRLLDQNDIPDRIVFINPFSQFITLSPEQIDCSQMTGEEMKVPLTFTCTNGNEGSNDDMLISAYAVRGTQMTLAGEITIVKNHATKVCKEKNVALIGVNLSVGSTVLKGERVLVEPEHIQYFYRALHQCLLYGSVTKVTEHNALSFASNSTFSTKYQGFSSQGKVTVIPTYAASKAAFQELNLELNHRFPGVYDNYAKVYYFDAQFGASPYTSGVTMDFSSQVSACFREVTILFTTPPHELLHSLGLYHIDDTYSKHEFVDIYKTNCVMSYSDRQPFSTWHWQWKVVNPAI